LTKNWKNALYILATPFASVHDDSGRYGKAKKEMIEGRIFSRMNG
jgi:hypothetical protein